MGYIYGKVTKGSSGDPIQGVQVGIPGFAGNVSMPRTDALGNYTISGLAIGTYNVSFTCGGYVTLSRQAPSIRSAGEMVLLNAQMQVTGEPPLTEKEYELRVHFQRLAWANEDSVTRAWTAGIVNPVGVGIVLLLQQAGYGGVTYGVNWTQNYCWIRCKPQGTLFIGAIPLGVFIGIVVAALIMAGVLYLYYDWFVIPAKKAAELVARVSETKADIATKLTDAYTSGAMTAEQYAAAMKALGETVNIPDYTPGEWNWPNLKDLEPIIILIVIIGAIILGYGALRR